MKFDFSKSNNSDFRNKFQLDKLDLINKNILYCTHELDKIKKIVTAIENSTNLQKQVDDYFEEDKENIPEVTDVGDNYSSN